LTTLCCFDLSAAISIIDFRLVHITEKNNNQLVFVGILPYNSNVFKVMV